MPFIKLNQIINFDLHYAEKNLFCVDQRLESWDKIKEVGVKSHYDTKFNSIKLILSSPSPKKEFSVEKAVQKQSPQNTLTKTPT